MSKNPTIKTPIEVGIPPANTAITHTAANDRIKVTYKERGQMKQVRCDCGALQFSATVGSIVETKCRNCKEVKTYKVAA